MTIIKNILELLAKNKLTTIEIAEKLNIPKNKCSVYLNTLYNDGRVERITNRTPFKYKVATTDTELLNVLFNIMINKTKFIEDVSEYEENIIKKIEGRIK